MHRLVLNNVYSLFLFKVLVIVDEFMNCIKLSENCKTAANLACCSVRSSFLHREPKVHEVNQEELVALEYRYSFTFLMNTHVAHLVFLKLNDFKIYAVLRNIQASQNVSYRFQNSRVGF